MAHTIETATVNPVTGKTRAQQLARLNEWKKHFLAEGVDKVIIKEAGAGNLNAAWIFEIHHKSAASYGALVDKYYKNPKSHDELMAKWQKTPTLEFTSFGLFFEIE